MNNFQEGFREGFKAKKSLGQNFLHAPHIISKMIHAGQVGKGSVILEVGPGKGALTEGLLGAGAHVIAVEKDDRAIPFIKEKFAEAVKNGQLEIIHGDILELGPEKLAKMSKTGISAGKYSLIANIPYYITGELLRMFLESDIQPERMVLMVQKEVAERIVAQQQGNGVRIQGKESILSISVKAFGQPKFIETVSKRHFRPVPKVDSAVILIDSISKHFFFEHNIAIPSFFRAVKAGFAHKRKVLIGNLGSIAPRETLDKLWIDCGLDPKVRAEDISLETWGSVAKALDEKIPTS